MSMEFRDEVILGLECCIKSDETGLCPVECPVRYKYGHECETGLKRDALELLKEQGTERLAKATADAENWMKKAPYLCYDLAKKLIAAAKEVTKDG